MTNFTVGFTWFIFGFIFGFISPYAYKVYKKYKENGNAKKIILEDAFLVCSSQIFNSLYDSHGSHGSLNSSTSLPELIDVSTNIMHISREYNKSFKIIIKNGNLIIRVIDKQIMGDKKFINILRFFKKNDIDLVILTSDEKVLKLE